MNWPSSSARSGARRAAAIGRLLAGRLWRVGAFYAGAFLLACLAIWRVERGAPETHVESFGDAVWFCLVTLSTVGYGDIYPVTGAGRVVAGLFILFTLTTIGFLLAAINDAVLEIKRMDEGGLLGTAMRGHVVVYGFGPIAQTAIQELLAAGRAVAVVCEHADELPAARRLASGGELFVTSGELSQGVLRERLNAAEARTAVIATSDDARNIVAALNVRAVSERVRIVVSVRAPELRQTLIASGVTYVASPYELSGRLVASAAFEPEVARFVEDVTSSVDDGFDLQQYPAHPFAGATVAEVREQLAAIDGPLLVAIAAAEGGGLTLLPHPPPGRRLAEGDQLIVLCDKAQAGRLGARFGVSQGR